MPVIAPWKKLTIKQRSTRLQQRATPTEIKLKVLLEADARLAGKFKFQAHVQGYYPDFSCRSAKLIIELDGQCHRSAEAKYSDAKRTMKLKRAGWRVIRFWNSELRNPQEVVERICAAANQPSTISISMSM